MENKLEGNNFVKEPKQKNKLMRFILNHKMVFLLLIIILVLIAYHMIIEKGLKYEYSQKAEALKKEYVLQIDSMRVANLQQTITVFSWAIRSELSRGNLEEVNQFFLNFVKEKDVQMISLINPENSEIILSTDKNNEGQIVTDKQILDSAFGLEAKEL
ncbi:MAG: hypothetical protein ABI638_07825, partial [Ignavibacteriota bacterium]